MGASLAVPGSALTFLMSSAVDSLLRPTSAPARWTEFVIPVQGIPDCRVLASHHPYLGGCAGPAPVVAARRGDRVRLTEVQGLPCDITHPVVEGEIEVLYEVFPCFAGLPMEFHLVVLRIFLDAGCKLAEVDDT